MTAPLKPLLVLLMLLPLASAWAQGGWRNVPPEDRAQLRQQMREQWRQDRQEPGLPARYDSPDGRSGWRDVSAEERQRLRQDLRDHGHRHEPRPPRHERPARDE
ncbi:MAG: hypothetical protein PHT48_07475 [Dechloromonas sp.]|nr:hypothetical protein [Dechloromonas sp.]